MFYKCRCCNEMFDEDELIQNDVGSYEDVRGTYLWIPCYQYTCPCCDSDNLYEYYPTDDEEEEREYYPKKENI